MCSPEDMVGFTESAKCKAIKKVFEERYHQQSSAKKEKKAPKSDLAKKTSQVEVAKIAAASEKKSAADAKAAITRAGKDKTAKAAAEKQAKVSSTRAKNAQTKVEKRSYIEIS